MRNIIKAYPVPVSIALLMVAMACFQVGAALAKGLFPLVGAAGTTALRLGLAAVILLAVWRPWRVRLQRSALKTIVVYGLALGWMNLFFYLSLNSIPLGIAVALEFTGPLALALLSSRRAVDFLWVAMATTGLVTLLPLGAGSRQLPTIGIVFALLAGGCWALYIVFGRRAGAASGGQSTALGALVGAAVIVPIGVIHTGTALFSLSIVPTALAIALLSSAIPYSLEMYALPRLPTQTYGVLMSLDPALAALSGMAFLGESLTGMQWTAVFCIMLASAGSALTSRGVPQVVADRLPD